MQSALTPSPGLVTSPAPRRAALVALCERRLAVRPGARLGRVLGVLIGLFTAGAMLVVATGSSRDALSVLDVLALKGIGWLSWLAAGSVALSAAHDWKGRDRDDGLVQLAQQRGFDEAQLGSARLAAVVTRISKVMGQPALALVLLASAFSGSLRMLALRTALLAGVAAYVLLLSVSLAVLARWSASLSPRRPHLVFWGALLLPELLAGLWPGVPSLIGLFGDLLERLEALGAL